MLEVFSYFLKIILFVVSTQRVLSSYVIYFIFEFYCTFSFNWSKILLCDRGSHLNLGLLYLFEFLPLLH